MAIIIYIKIYLKKLQQNIKIEIFWFYKIEKCQFLKDTESFHFG